ncbi:MAG: hypothetical protein ACUVRX_08995 [Actinomycetota bacterium]
MGVVMDMTGGGFIPGSWVRLEKEGRLMEALFNMVWSETRLRATADLGAAWNGEFMSNQPQKLGSGEQPRALDFFTVDPAGDNGPETALLILGLSMADAHVQAVAADEEKRATGDKGSFSPALDVRGSGDVGQCQRLVDSDEGVRRDRGLAPGYKGHKG